MTKAAHIIDIIVRSFFLFVAFWLVFSYVFKGFFAVLAGTVLVNVGINVIFELTAGKKYWRSFTKNAKPRRKFMQTVKEFFVQAFAWDKTKGFVWAGAVILMMSLVVRLNAYYVICACVVFTFAALTRFAPRRECTALSGGENPAPSAGGIENGSGRPAANESTNKN
jgi:hypothetical protein